MFHSEPLHYTDFYACILCPLSIYGQVLPSLNITQYQVTVIGSLQFDCSNYSLNLFTPIWHLPEWMNYHWLQHMPSFRICCHLWLSFTLVWIKFYDWRCTCFHMLSRIQYSKILTVICKIFCDVTFDPKWQPGMTLCSVPDWKGLESKYSLRLISSGLRD